MKSVLISFTIWSSRECAALYDEILPASHLYKAEKLLKRSEKERHDVINLSAVYIIKQLSTVQLRETSDSLATYFFCDYEHCRLMDHGAVCVKCRR